MAAAQPEGSRHRKSWTMTPPRATRRPRWPRTSCRSADLRELELVRRVPRPHLDRGGKNWRLLFVDARLRQWLLFPSEDIVAETRQPDQSAPFGKRDVVWVRGDAPVLRGHAPRSVEGRFL